MLEAGYILSFEVGEKVRSSLLRQALGENWLGYLHTPLTHFMSPKEIVELVIEPEIYSMDAIPVNGTWLVAPELYWRVSRLRNSLNAVIPGAVATFKVVPNHAYSNVDENSLITVATRHAEKLEQEAIDYGSSAMSSAKTAPATYMRAALACRRAIRMNENADRDTDPGVYGLLEACEEYADHYCANRSRSTLKYSLMKAVRDGLHRERAREGNMFSTVSAAGLARAGVAAQSLNWKSKWWRTGMYGMVLNDHGWDLYGMGTKFVILKRKDA